MHVGPSRERSNEANTRGEKGEKRVGTEEHWSILDERDT